MQKNVLNLEHPNEKKARPGFRSTYASGSRMIPYRVTLKMLDAEVGQHIGSRSIVRACALR